MNGLFELPAVEARDAQRVLDPRQVWHQVGRLLKQVGGTWQPTSLCLQDTQIEVTLGQAVGQCGLELGARRRGQIRDR